LDGSIDRALEDIDRASRSVEEIERLETLKREMQSAFHNLAELYLQALKAGLFVRGSHETRDIAEDPFYDHFQDPAVRAEYEAYLAAYERDHPARDPEPEDYGLGADGLEMER
jgi:altronate dehydratase